MNRNTLPLLAVALGMALMTPFNTAPTVKQPERPKRSRSFTAERKAAAEAKRERKRMRRLKRGY